MPPDFGPLDALRGRMMICRPAEVVPIEAVVRGYLAGSGWKEYRERGTVCRIPLPAGLREGDRLPEPIFTPATKAELGEHDENIDFDGMVEHIGGWLPGGDVAAAGKLPATEADFLSVQDPTWGPIKRSRERDECREKLIALKIFAQAWP